MDIKLLKETILQDTENIFNILQSIGCDRITKLSNEYRCAKNSEDTNATRVVVKINESLSSKIYDLIPISGDILTLVMELQQCSLPQAIKICCEAIGVKYHSHFEKDIKPKKKVFGGFFDNINKSNFNNIELNFYEDDVLNQFINQGNVRFYNDGIDYYTQALFNIMYDDYNNRIVVPWKYINGKIVGMMGRYNEDEDICNKNNIAKWLPIQGYQFYKSYLLYGLYENYKYIIESGRVYVGESEKFVLQSASFGVRNTVAIGSHNISLTQRDILISLKVEIVTCMDNDIPDEFNLTQCKQLQSKSCLIGGKVGFIMNEGILKGKDSPTDNGIDIWNKCIDNIFWL